MWSIVSALRIHPQKFVAAFGSIILIHALLMGVPVVRRTRLWSSELAKPVSSDENGVIATRETTVCPTQLGAGGRIFYGWTGDHLEPYSRWEDALLREDAL